MGSDLHLAPVEAATLIDADAAANTELIQMRHGGGGPATRFVCGYLACSRSVCRPLLDNLPRMLRIPIGEGPGAALLRELLRVGVRESSASRPGALLHGEPGRAWTVDELGREVALSRSALAERFTALVGEPPMQYLMRWRLALAAQSLRSAGEPIARVAARTGYESEAAFNRAFKREFGMPPATWRRQGKAPSVDA